MAEYADKFGGYNDIFYVYFQYIFKIYLFIYIKCQAKWQCRFNIYIYIYTI